MKIICLFFTVKLRILKCNCFTNSFVECIFLFHDTYLRCDISNKEAVDEFFAKAKEILGGLDVLANIAGLKRRYPIDGSMGEAERNCAPIIIFLASDASRYMSGQIFCVNGGGTMVR